jgi:glutathione S-transferase
MGTLGRHGKFAPYVAGESFTLADLYFMYSLSLACGVGEKLFGLDLLEQLPKAKALLARLNEMPNAQKVEADRQAAMPAFMAMIAAKK